MYPANDYLYALIALSNKIVNSNIIDNFEFFAFLV